MIDGNDMIVNLYRLPTLEDRKDTIQIKRAFVGDKEAILTFIKENFSNSQVYEAEHALLQEVPKCFIAVETLRALIHLRKAFSGRSVYFLNIVENELDNLFY